MARQLFQHMIEESDPGLDVIGARASRPTVAETRVSVVVRSIEAWRMALEFQLMNGAPLSRCGGKCQAGFATAFLWPPGRLHEAAALIRMTHGRAIIWHGTTILSVRKGKSGGHRGDGQVSLGQTVIKGNARKVRPLGSGQVIGGFAGATADAMTLFERLESKLEQ